MLSGDQFISLLEEKDILPPEVLAGLKHELQEATKPPSAVTLAKRLVHADLLTRSMAERLLASIGESLEPKKPAAPPSAGKTPGSKSPAAGKTPAGQPEAGKPAPQAPAVRSLLDEELPPINGLGAQPLDALRTSGAMEESTGGPLLGEAPPRRFKLRRFLKNLFRRNRSQVVRVEAADPRQVKMLLVSWGVAVALFVGAFGLLWYLSPPGPEDLLLKAEVASDTGQYPEAIATLDLYLAKYPQHKSVSEARVRLALASMYQASAEAEESGDWSPAFQVAQEVVKPLADEPAYVDYQRKVALALAKIGEGLAQQSRTDPKPTVVREARLILAMIEMKVHAAYRPQDKMAHINYLLESSEQKVGQDQALDETVAAIKEALGKGETAAAYAARNSAVRRFPELADHARLEEALAPAAETFRKAVKFARQDRAAETAERPSAALAAVAMALRTVQGTVAEVKGRQVFAAFGGSAFGLDATDGTLLWRRFVHAPSPRGLMTPPIAVTDSSGDVLLTDLARHEILRVQGASGRLKWRQSLAKPLLAGPVLAGNRLLTPFEPQRLASLDLATGALVGEVELPQKIHVAPAVDLSRSLVFQAADESNLYVLSLADWTCRQVFHVGHAAGSLGAPPVVAGDYLLLVVNDEKDSVLKVLSISPSGKASEGGPLKLVQKLSVQGRVKTPPLVGEGRVLLATAQGGLDLFRIGKDAKSPLERIARSEVSGDEQLDRSAMMQAGRFWLADMQLARYEVRAEDGRLVPRQITDSGQWFVQPPELLGQVICHVRQKPGMPGITVSAVSVERHEPIWQTWVGAPLAGEPLVDQRDGKLTVVTASGGMFRFDPAAIGKQTTTHEPFLAVEPTKMLRPICDVTPLGEGAFTMTFGPGTRQIIVYDPQERDKQFRWIVSPSDMACAPAALGKGLLVACTNGRVCLLDPKATGELAKSYQPSLAAVTDWKWLPPAPAGPKHAVLCDGDRRLYVIRLESDDEPSLREAAAASASGKISSALAVVGTTAYVGYASGEVGCFALPGLTEAKPQSVGGRCDWGPRRIGDRVLLSTDKGRLCCFDGKPAPVWNVAASYGPLAGSPWAAGESIYLASQSGMVWRISAATGEEQGKADVGCPLGTGPVLLGDRLYVGSRDGCIIEAKRP